MQVLRARLYDLEREKIHSAEASARKSMVGSGDRSERIRTYNFPLARVTYHRINLPLHPLPALIQSHIASLLFPLFPFSPPQSFPVFVFSCPVPPPPVFSPSPFRLA